MQDHTGDNSAIAVHLCSQTCCRFLKKKWQGKLCGHLLLSGLTEKKNNEVRYPRGSTITKHANPRRTY